MKISFNTNLYTNISCRGQIPVKTIGFSDIKKIASDKEYNNLLENLKNRGDFSDWWAVGNNFEQGLMPYIGREDICSRINSFLRTGTLIDNRYTKSFMENIVRLFDYSLQKLDEIYGKYEGFVYRYGQVDLNSRNYISAAKDPNGAASFVDEQDRRNCNKPFHVIQIKNGHKIEEVQKKLNYNQNYIEESEIITNPTHFEYVDNPSPEMIDAREKLKEAIKKQRIYGSKIILLKEV